MRLIGIAITACIILAAAQAVMAVLAVLLLMALVYALFTAPKETLGFMGLLIAASLIQAFPVLCVGFACMIVLAGIIRGSKSG